MAVVWYEMTYLSSILMKLNCTWAGYVQLMITIFIVEDAIPIVILESLYAQKSVKCVPYLNLIHFLCPMMSFNY